MRLEAILDAPLVRSVRGQSRAAERADARRGTSRASDAAHEAGAELFLAPKDNCSEAAASDHGDMSIAEVSTLDEAVSTMKDFADGKDIKTCQ